MKILLGLILLFLSFEAFTMRIKPRLREHFESHDIKSGNQTYTYKGLSNTLNLWYEKPFDFAVGLAVSPVLANIKYKEGDKAIYGEKIKLFAIGVEAKHFPLKILPQMFYRAGLYYTELQADTVIGDQSGWSLLGGIGLEFKVWKMGIAPEFSVRRSFLENSTSVLSIIPAIGLHFYVM